VSLRVFARLAKQKFCVAQKAFCFFRARGECNSFRVAFLVQVLSQRLKKCRWPISSGWFECHFVTCSDLIKVSLGGFAPARLAPCVRSRSSPCGSTDFFFGTACSVRAQAIFTSFDNLFSCSSTLFFSTKRMKFCTIYLAIAIFFIFTIFPVCISACACSAFFYYISNYFTMPIINFLS
jgi:hypothetical protein